MKNIIIDLHKKTSYYRGNLEIINDLIYINICLN